MADRDLVVRFIGDDRSLNQAFNRQERRSKQFETRTTAMGVSVSRAFAAAGITLGGTVALREIGRTIDAASALNEQVARTEVVFDSSADAVKDWSETTAQSMGISQRAALEASATFGGLFRTLDIGPAKAAAMSQRLVQLAADLASLQDTSPEEALLALRSGLIGEAEPLRRYSVRLSETRVQQQAMADTGKENAAALTDQEKALARYNIILEDSILAHGNFADTQGELANQTRTATANLEDFRANVGELLIPTVEEGARAGNELFGVLDKLAGVDVGLGLDVGDLAGYIGGWKTINFLIDQAKGGVEDLKDETERTFQGSPDSLDRFRESLEQLDEAAQEATRSSSRFKTSLKGLGLKLDKAQLTGSLADDLSVLNEMERRIKRQIREEGRTFDLVEELTQIRAQKARLVEQQSTEAGRAAQQSWEDMLAALNLNLERALSTAKLDDDLAALKRIERALQERIKAEGRTADLERQLFENRQEQARTRQQQREQRQFGALGLTAEGEARGPSARNLRQRASRLEDQIKGTALDTAKTRAQLARIAKVLSGQFGKVGKDVRAAILAMLNDITSALREGSRKTADAVTTGTGEITRGGIISTSKLIEGLGLTPEQEAAIRERNRGAGIRGGRSAFGHAIGEPAPGRRPSSSAAGFGGGAGEPLIELHVFLDGKEVESTVTKRQIRKGRRTSASRRGRAGANKLGLG